MPSCTQISRKNAATEPFPFVPAMWTNLLIGKRCGRLVAHILRLHIVEPHIRIRAHRAKLFTPLARKANTHAHEIRMPRKIAVVVASAVAAAHPVRRKTNERREHKRPLPVHGRAAVVCRLHHMKRALAQILPPAHRKKFHLAVAYHPRKGNLFSRFQQPVDKRPDVRLAAKRRIAVHIARGEAERVRPQRRADSRRLFGPLLLCERIPASLFLLSDPLLFCHRPNSSRRRRGHQLFVLIGAAEGGEHRGLQREDGHQGGSQVDHLGGG